MSEAKDPKIKLFGKTIQLPDKPPPETAADGGESGGGGPAESDDATGDDITAQDRPCSTNSLPEESNLDKGGEEQESEKELVQGKLSEGKEEHGAQSSISEELSDSHTNPLENENSNAVHADNDAAPAKTSKTEEQCENSDSQEKTPKKPDKILPCPRCNSMDTKFCYFNNYNVNQPRHFCKNCQRYWTAGGTMRNVPVGAGRRKNKNSANQYRHITVPEALQNIRADLPNGIHHPTLSPNGTVLTFGSDTPLCESMASALNIAEKSMQNSSRNGFQQPEELRLPVSNRTGASRDQSCGSSLTAGNSNDEVHRTGLPETVVPNYPNFPPQVPCFPGGPWPYPWNSVPWSPPVAPPGFCPPGFPMAFYPAAAYWGCNLPGTWNVPWVTPPTTSQNHPPPTSGPNSPTLGKHSRDDNKPASNEEEEPKRESNPEKCLWVPKTLRIDDPGDAAKSSIWATLGIKSDKTDSVGGGGLFKPFQSKSEETTPPETSTVLQANPAALSRSVNFHERS